MSSKYYYAFDNIDELGLALEWPFEDIEKFDKMIDAGLPAETIAMHFERPITDVIILALERRIKRGNK